MVAKFFLAATIFFISFSPASATLQYFGYYHVNGIPADSRDHISEIGTRGNANIGLITVSYPDKIPGYLAEMRKHKMYAIFDVTSRFESVENERIANWRNLKEAIKGYEDIVYGFYFDESVWRGIGVNEFRSYTKQIRDDFPDKATILVEAYPTIYHNKIPAGYLEYITDFGFDFYPTSAMEGDPANFEKEWTNYLTYFAMFSALSSGKKVWLIPDGFEYYTLPASYLAIVLQRNYELAMTHPEVVGMLVFTYDFGNSEYFYTIRDAMNPNSKYYDSGLVHTHNSVGRAIIANSPPYPSSSPTTKPGDLNGDTRVDLFDFNLLISKFGNPYTLLDFNAIISNYGK